MRLDRATGWPQVLEPSLPALSGALNVEKGRFDTPAASGAAPAGSDYAFSLHKPYAGLLRPRGPSRSEATVVTEASGAPGARK